MSLLMASDSGEDAGISLNDRKVLTIGFLSGKNDRVKTAELLLYGEQQPCIGDRRFDFQTVSHNAVESHQPFDVFIGHLRHPLGIEIAKGFAIPLALPENSYPAQSGLGALQHEKLEQRLVVGHQFSPLPIMVFHIQLVGSAPAAASVYDVLHNHNV